MSVLSVANRRQKVCRFAMDVRSFVEPKLRLVSANLRASYKSDEVPLAQWEQVSAPGFVITKSLSWASASSRYEEKSVSCFWSILSATKVFLSYLRVELSSYSLICKVSSVSGNARAAEQHDSASKKKSLRFIASAGKVAVVCTAL